MKNVLFTAFFAGMALCASAQKTVFVSPNYIKENNLTRCKSISYTL